LTSPSPLVRLIVQVAALLITGTGAVANLKSDIANVQASVATIQNSVSSIKQQVLDTQSDLQVLNGRVDGLTNDLLGRP